MEDAAHEIGNVHLTREGVIALMKRYARELPKRCFNVFLEYLDITEGHFVEYSARSLVENYNNFIGELIK